MPEVSRFYGIIIRMFSETGEQHHIPHLHAYYQDHRVVYGIDRIIVLVGGLPVRQKRLVEAWIELHQEQLMENWRHIEVGEPVDRIPPLA